MNTAERAKNHDRLALTRIADQAAGERLQDTLQRALSSKGEIVSFVLTPSAGYAAVKNSTGRVEAFVVPYEVNFRDPAPRTVKYGAISERDNPSMAAAPMAFVEGLSPVLDDGSTAWRQRCWASQVGRQASMQVMSIGEVLMLGKAIDSNHGPLRPDYYTVRAHNHGFTVLESIATGKSAMVHNLASSAVKVGLDADPQDRLTQHPGVVRFSVMRVAKNDDLQHHLLVGRTASGSLVPLAKADSPEDRDFMLQRMWEVAKLRQEALRDFPYSQVHSYVAENNLAVAVVDQAMGRPVAQIEELDISIEPPSVDLGYDRSPGL